MDVKKIIIVCLLCALTVLSGHIISVRKTISVLEKSVDEIGNQYKRYIVAGFPIRYELLQHKYLLSDYVRDVFLMGNSANQLIAYVPGNVCSACISSLLVDLKDYKDETSFFIQERNPHSSSIGPKIILV